jgi:hypothetical protein
MTESNPPPTSLSVPASSPSSAAPTWASPPCSTA